MSTPVRVWTRAELDAEIADRNARFDALTPAERRVAISQEQLAMIEVAFECDRRRARDHKDPGVAPPDIEDELDAAVEFGSQYESPRERLLAIAQNVIDNGGEFVP